MSDKSSTNKIHVTKGDMTELKSLANPPKLIKIVMNAVCILFNVPLGWRSAQNLMADPSFLNKKIGDYDVTNITDKMLEELKPFIENPEFVPDNVAKKAAACKKLCEWVIETYKHALQSRK